MCSKVQINYASATSLIYLVCYVLNIIEPQTESWLSSKTDTSTLMYKANVWYAGLITFLTCMAPLAFVFVMVSSSSLTVILQNIQFGIMIFISGLSCKCSACIYFAQKRKADIKAFRPKDKWIIVSIKWKDVNWEGKEKRGKCSHNAVLHLKSDHSWVISYHHDQVWIDITVILLYRSWNSLSVTVHPQHAFGLRAPLRQNPILGHQAAVLFEHAMYCVHMKK